MFVEIYVCSFLWFIAATLIYIAISMTRAGFFDRKSDYVAISGGYSAPETNINKKTLAKFRKSSLANKNKTNELIDLIVSCNWSGPEYDDTLTISKEEYNSISSYLIENYCLHCKDYDLWKKSVKYYDLLGFR